MSKFLSFTMVNYHLLNISFVQLKNFSIGSGILHLLFSLILLVWGSSEGKHTPSVRSIFPQSSLNSNLVISDSLDFQSEGLLQRQSEIRKVHNVTVKLPFSTGGAFLFQCPIRAQARNNQLTENPSFLSSIDLPVRYRNLRL